MGGGTLYAASPPRAGGPQILTYIAFCKASLDQFAGTAASRGEFGFMASPHRSVGIAASSLKGDLGFKVLTSMNLAESANGRLETMAVSERPPRDDGRHRRVRPGRSVENWKDHGLIAIGADMNLLRQRVIQMINGPTIWTGFGALSELIGKNVHT